MVTPLQSKVNITGPETGYCRRKACHLNLKVLGKSVACAKLQREMINCTSVYLFLYGESSVKISTQTDSC